jgi:hypothetical protein
MTLRHALLMLVLATPACTHRPQPIPAVAQARQCPPLLPLSEALLKPPVKTDFLPATR